MSVTIGKNSSGINTQVARRADGRPFFCDRFFLYEFQYIIDTAIHYPAFFSMLSSDTY